MNNDMKYGGLCPTCCVPYDFCTCTTGLPAGSFPEGIPVNPWLPEPPLPTPTKIIIGINPERIMKLKQYLRDLILGHQERLLEEVEDEIDKLLI